MCSDQGIHVISTKAVGMSLLHHAVRQEPFAELSCFRGEFYSCLTRRSDALFELADAVLCADGPVRSLVELSLVGEHRRGHGGLYDSPGRGSDGYCSAATRGSDSSMDTRHGARWRACFAQLWCRPCPRTPVTSTPMAKTRTRMKMAMPRTS